MSGSSPETPRSLAEDLRGRSDDDLMALLRARPDLANPVPVDIGQLASRATTRASVARALDRLDRFTLHVVEAVAVLPEPASSTRIRKLLGVRSAAVDGALATLRKQALVSGSARALRLVRVVHEIIGPFPAGLGPPVRSALLAHSPGQLAQIVRDLGGAATGDPVADAETVGTAITGGLDDLLADLGEEAVGALRSLSAGPPTGRVDAAQREVDRSSARSPIDHLLATGLLVPTDNSTVVLPREIGLHLRGGVLRQGLTAEPPALDSTDRDATSVDRTAGVGAFDTVRRIETLLDTWGQEPPLVLRTGGLGVRDLRRLPALLDLDEPTAAFVAELAYVAGLVAPGGTAGDVWLPTPAYDGWLRKEPAARWVELTAAWLTTSRVAGLVGSRDDRNRPVAPLGPNLDRPLAPEVRRLVLTALATAPAGHAPTGDSVVELVRWSRPRRGGQLRDDLVRWTLREAEILGVTGHAALASFVRPLLDDAARDEAHQVAEAALAKVLPELLDHVLLQADLTAIAPGPLRADVARELALISEVESRGGASVHRFTPDSVRKALDAGRSADEIHDFLARVSRTPVPQPLTYLVDDVARRHGLLRVGAASSFIRCDDQAVLAEILANPGASALGLRRAAASVLVSPLDPKTLLERLRQLGFRPTPEAADGSVAITKAEPARAIARPAPQPLLAERPPPPDPVLAAAVRALRAGERTAEGRPSGATPGRLGRSASGQTIAALRTALDSGATIWIGYVDHHGSTSERVVDPVRLEGGWLTAFDHRSGEVRSFAVHRISGVAPVDDSSTNVTS